MNNLIKTSLKTVAGIALSGSTLFASADNSKIADSSAALVAGDTIPDAYVSGVDDGRSIGLREIVSKKPTILIFYRGGWCPYCNTHLGKLQTIESEVLAAGYQIAAISPDRPEELQKSITRHSLTYNLYSDSSMSAAKAFRLAFTVDNVTVVKYRLVGINLEKASGEKHHMLPVPAVFIVDMDGVIRYAYSNPDYKVRMETDKILELLKKN